MRCEDSYLGQFVLDCDSNLFFGGKDLVQIDFGDCGTDLVKDQCCQLGPGISQLVKSVVQILALDLVLHGDIDFYEHVIASLGLAPAVNLLNTKGHAPSNGLSNAAPNAVEPGMGHAAELAELFNHLNAGLVCMIKSGARWEYSQE